MFWHSFKYNILTIVRDKQQVFWSLIFVVLLGTLFNATFNNAYEQSDLLADIKVAVYIEDEMVSKNFTDIIENITVDEEGESKLLDVRKCASKAEAEAVLEESDTCGMFYSEDGSLKLMVKQNGIRESILSNIVSQYHQIVTVMTQVSEKNPQVMQQVMELLMGEGGENAEKVLTEGSMDVFVQYFYNLIAMSCLFASLGSMPFVVRNQANLSSLGARNTMGNANGFVHTFAGIMAMWVIQSVMTILSLVYLVIVGVDFGSNIPGIVITIVSGVLVGVALGFFIGSIGRLTQAVKESLTVGVSMICCFLSGLMFMDIKMMIEINCPIINDINPAVMISDAFYSLNVYSTYTRFAENIVKMVALAVILIVGGVLMGRRKQYASI